MTTAALLTATAELRAALDVALAESDRWRALAQQAQAVINQVRWAVENHYAPPPLCDALAAYDAALKARAK